MRCFFEAKPKLHKKYTFTCYGHKRIFEGILTMKQTIIGLGFMLFASLAFAQFSLSEGSEARFYIDEVLLGNDKTVIGITPDVTGEISFDLADPQAASIGVITINARDLTTDSDRRNGAIQRRVLNSNDDAFQFITFTPTSIAGLPESAAVGDSFDMQITGDLTIKETTLEVVFETNVTISSETELQGLGSTIINYKDFNLTIPKVPAVASVEDEVKLELAFTATQ